MVSFGWLVALSINSSSSWWYSSPDSSLSATITMSGMDGGLAASSFSWPWSALYCPQSVAGDCGTAGCHVTAAGRVDLAGIAQEGVDSNIAMPEFCGSSAEVAEASELITWLLPCHVVLNLP